MSVKQVRLQRATHSGVPTYVLDALFEIAVLAESSHQSTEYPHGYTQQCRECRAEWPCPTAAALSRLEWP